MKKYIFGFIIALALVGSSASAQSRSSLQGPISVPANTASSIAPISTQTTVSTSSAATSTVAASTTGNTSTSSPAISMPYIPAVCYAFSQNMRVGSRGEQVRQLQIFLNQYSDTRVAQVGAGSLGNETLYFGPATMRAVIKFQEKHSFDVLAPAGLVRGTGFVGRLTLAKLNSLCGNNPPAQDVPVITSLTPVSGPVGTTVRVYGTNLQGANAIEFGSGFIPKQSFRQRYSSSTGVSEYLEFDVPEYTGVCSSTSQVCAMMARQVTPGEYSVAVTNSKGTSNKLTFTVSSTTSDITVISPNGGETWAWGSQHTIQWQTPNVTYIQAPRYDISLVPQGPACLYTEPRCLMTSMPALMIKPYTVAQNMIGSSGLNSYTWKVGSTTDVDRTLPEGNYKVQICNSGGGSCDTGDNFFTIASSTPQ